MSTISITRTIPRFQPRDHLCTTSYSQSKRIHHQLDQLGTSCWPHQNQLRKTWNKWVTGNWNICIQWSLQTVSQVIPFGSLIARAPTCSPLINFKKSSHSQLQQLCVCFITKEEKNTANIEHKFEGRRRKTFGKYLCFWSGVPFLTYKVNISS